MNLHRTNGKPDWQNVTREQQNSWQRTASASRGLVTLSNAATLIGFILVLAGLYLLLQERYISAAILLLIGRFFDLVDGWLADITATKSPFGEALDATVDKIVTFLGLIALYISAVIPEWALAAITLIQVVTTIVVLINRRRGRPVQPSIEGKMGIALAWIALSGYVFLAGLNTTSSGALTVCGIVAVFSILFSSYALLRYAKPVAKSVVK